MFRLLFIFSLAAQAAAASMPLKIIEPINKKPNLLEQMAGEDHTILNLTHPPFVALSKNWQWQCMVCKKIPNKEDGSLKKARKRRVKKIHTNWEIKDTYFWSNGEPVTGYDVKRSINLLRPKLTHINKLVKDIKVDENNPRKFSIIFRSYRSTFFQLLAIRLIPRDHSLKLSYGPYRVSVWGKNAVKLRKNIYDRKGDVSFDTIDIIDGNADTLLKKPRYPTIVMPGALAKEPEILKNLEKKGRKNGYKFYTETSPELISLFFNLRNPDFANKKVRIALAKALYDQQIGAAYYGDSSYKTQSFSHPADPICPVELLEKESQPEETKKIPLPKKIRIALPNTPRKKAYFESIKKAWQGLGIKVEKTIVSEAFFKERVLQEAHFKDLALVSWRTSPGTLPLSVFYSKEIPSYENRFKGQNITGWLNREVDDLLKAFYKAKSQKDLVHVCEKLHRNFKKDQPIIPLSFTPMTIAVSSDIKGFLPIWHLYSSSLYARDWRVLK